jgi:hypothetical protein
MTLMFTHHREASRPGRPQRDHHLTFSPKHRVSRCGFLFHQSVRAGGHRWFAIQSRHASRPIGGRNRTILSMRSIPPLSCCGFFSHQFRAGGQGRGCHPRGECLPFELAAAGAIAGLTPTQPMPSLRLVFHQFRRAAMIGVLSEACLAIRPSRPQRGHCYSVSHQGHVPLRLFCCVSFRRRPAKRWTSSRSLPPV